MQLALKTKLRHHQLDPAETLIDNLKIMVSGPLRSIRTDAGSQKMKYYQFIT